MTKKHAVLAVALAVLAALAAFADSYLIFWSPNPPSEGVTNYTVRWRQPPASTWQSLSTTDVMARITVGAGLWEVTVAAASSNGLSDQSAVLRITNFINQIYLSNLSATLSWSAGVIATGTVFRLWRVASIPTAHGETQWDGLVEFRFLSDQLVPKIYFMLDQSGPGPEFYRITQEP